MSSGRLMQTVLKEHSLRVRCSCGELLEQIGIHDYSEDPQRVAWIVDVQLCPNCTDNDSDRGD